MDNINIHYWGDHWFKSYWFIVSKVGRISKTACSIMFFMIDFEIPRWDHRDFDENYRTVIFSHGCSYYKRYHYQRCILRDKNSNLNEPCIKRPYLTFWVLLLSKLKSLEVCSKQYGSYRMERPWKCVGWVSRSKWQVQIKIKQLRTVT